MPTAAIHIMCQELNYQRLPCSKMDIVERIFSGLSFIKVLIMSNSTVKELIYIHILRYINKLLCYPESNNSGIKTLYLTIVKEFWWKTDFIKSAPDESGVFWIEFEFLSSPAILLA
jgi:hypothetical protein